MDAKILEWLKQADYDMDTAEFMAAGGQVLLRGLHVPPGD